MPSPGAFGLLDPRNDFVFKTLFVRGTALLCDLINAVRTGQPPIASLEILNPDIAPEALQGKAIVLDILARDVRGRRFNIEMQIRRVPGITRRGVFYLARVMAGQLQVGEDYSTMEPVIGVHLLDFTLFDDWPDVACWTFELRDRHRPQVAFPDSSLELNLVELPKADRLGENETGALAEWVRFFKHALEPDIMRRINHPPVRGAMSLLRKISDDELNQLNAFARERALMDQRSFENAARAEGREEGWKEGRKEGHDEGRASLLVEQLTHRFGPLSGEVIARIEAGKPSDLGRWSLRVLSAGSLDEVFAEDL